MKKQSFKQAFFDFLNSGSFGRQIVIFLIIMAAAVGAIYMLGDLLS